MISSAVLNAYTYISERSYANDVTAFPGQNLFLPEVHERGVFLIPIFLDFGLILRYKSGIFVYQIVQIFHF